MTDHKTSTPFSEGVGDKLCLLRNWGKNWRGLGVEQSQTGMCQPLAGVITRLCLYGLVCSAVVADLKCLCVSVVGLLAEGGTVF